MASTLSPSAVHRIIFLVENDDRPIRIRKKKNTPYADSYILKTVNYKWKTVFKLYSEVKPAPPLDYLNSLELALVFKDEVGEADVAAILAHGKPLQFWGCPPLLLPKTVEAFSALQKEPTCLDVTITALLDVDDNDDMRLAEAWSQICSIHLPCYARTTVETVEERRYLRYSSHVIPSSLAPAKAVAVEKFHVFSKAFRKRLALEVHSQFEPGTTGTQLE